MRSLIRQAAARLDAPFRAGSLGAGIGLKDFAVTIAGLTGTSLVTTAFGFPFWWLAARLFTPAAVGLASAVIAAMLLLGSVATFGLGALLVRELPRSNGHESALIARALIVAAAFSTIVAMIFALVTSRLGGDLEALGRPVDAALFVVGASVASVSFVFDAALIGLLRGDLNFARNLLMSAGKLVLLVPAAAVLASDAWEGIYGAWVLAVIASLLIVGSVAAVRGAIPRRDRTSPSPALAFGPAAVRHFALNLTLQVPILGMPILVTALGGSEVNASFYIAWLIGGANTILPSALSNTLYAIGSRAREAVQTQTRVTLALSAIAAGCGTVALALVGAPLLGAFGSTYTASEPALIAIAAASLPGVVKQHFHVLLRIRGQLTEAAVFCGLGAVLELAMAAAGLAWRGVTGLAIAWLLALCIEAVLMAPTVYASVSRRSPEVTRIPSGD